MISFGKVLDDVSRFNHYLEVADQCPIIKYKLDDVIPPDPYWVNYPKLGSLWIMPRIYKNPKLNKLVDEIIPIIKTLVPPDHVIKRYKFALIRTLGSVTSHIDEVSRSSIHIGLKNSGIAATRYHENEDRNVILSSHHIEEGHAYTFNPKQRHSVQTDQPDLYRYFIAYRFDLDYAELVEYLKKS